MTKQTTRGLGRSRVEKSSMLAPRQDYSLKGAWRWLALGMLAGLTAWPVGSAELTWLTDLAKTQAQAGAGKKSVLLFFHGSDWCPTCRELERDVIKSPEFIAYARGALVLVDVDFPTKGAQGEALKRANAALRQRSGGGAAESPAPREASGVNCGNRRIQESERC